MAGRRHWLLGLLIAMYALPPCIIIGWAGIHRSLLTAVASLLTTLIVAAISATVTRRWRAFFLLQFPFYALGLAFIAYTVSYGMPPGQTFANLLIGASLEEARGIMTLPQERSLVWVSLAWAVTYLALASAIRSDSIFQHLGKAARRGFLALVLILLLLTIPDPAQLIDGIALQPMVGSVMFLSGDVPRARELVMATNVQKIPYGAKRSGGAEIHILIIGEAARRDSWSAYGYARSTTPQLDALGDQVVWFRGASADANLTQWAVPILLTGTAPDEVLAARFTGNLFDLAKEAGYRTAWLVNQDITTSAIVGVRADVLEYPPDFNYSINGRHTYDETLLPALRKTLKGAQASRFIGIHMMGSHWEYYNRYPERFRRYGDAETLKKLSMVSVLVAGKGNEMALVDSYDNSVLYTDWFLRQVIDDANESSVPATVTFFPDHGEDLQLLDGSAGHGAPFFTPHAFSIPAFIWFNPAYRNLHPRAVAAAQANSTKRIRSYNLFYSMAELMGITWPGFKPTLSFASPDFIADQTTGVIAGGVLLPTPPSYQPR
jgi:glucan phosphoethanolaminetransferase (alkaline phosphatase superfamily)